jgi:hypothetical protein
MQTVEENKINYIVFPRETFSSSSLELGQYFLYAYETLANDTGSGDNSIATVTQQGDRWRVANTYIESTNTSDNDKLFLRAGTTYEVELKWGVLSAETWGESKTLWVNTSNSWSYDTTDFDTPNSVVVSRDRLFCSGSVSPNQKLYISSNEDAEMVIYHQ